MQTLTREEIVGELQAAIKRLRRFCEPEWVVLFGSYAYGQPHKGSDVDLLLVLPDEASEEQGRKAGEILHHHFGPGLQIHRCTLSQWREALLRRNWFVAEVTQRGIPLFSRRKWSSVLAEVEELMNQSQNLYPMEWIERAEEDWQLMELALDRGLVFGAAYHLQQAIEKWLKAFLLHHGWQLERTHELEHLLDEAVIHAPNLERFRAMCHRVNYFIAARYPGLPQPPTIEELREQWLPQAEELRAFVRGALGADASSVNP